MRGHWSFAAQVSGRPSEREVCRTGRPAPGDDEVMDAWIVNGVRPTNGVLQELKFAIAGVQPTP